MSNFTLKNVSVTWHSSLVLALAPLSLLWLKEVVAVAATTFQLKRKFMQYQIFSLKRRDLYWRDGK